jgi:hypothetical protein
VRPILWRQQIGVLNGDPNQGIPRGIELELCGPSDSDVPAAEDPIVIIHSTDDDPDLGDDLRVPLAALKDFLASSAAVLSTNFKKGGKK